MLRLNLHFALLLFAFGFIDFFGPAYLYKLGYTVPQITGYWVCFFLIRLIARPFLLILCHSVGVKRAFLFGAGLFSFRYLFYAGLQSFPELVVVLLVFESITSALYWLLYHVLFAESSRAFITGSQVAWREVVIHVVRVLSPLCAALTITSFGFTTAFFFATVVSLLSLIPVVALPLEDRPLPALRFQELWRVEKAGFWMYQAAAFHEYGHIFVWKLALFLYMKDYLEYGVLLAVMIFFQVVGTLVMGRRFDKGLALKPALFGIGVMLVVLFARGGVSLTVPVIICLDFLFMVGSVLSSPVLNANVYSRSRSSGNPLWYQTLTESGWDLGALTALLLVTGLLLLDIELRSAMLVSAVGLVSLGVAFHLFDESRSEKNQGR